MKFIIYKAIGIILVLLIFGTGSCFAQIGLNSTGDLPDASAMLDVSSNEKGILVPIMTEVQINNIASPATGLLVYQTDGTSGFYYYNGTSWDMFGTQFSGNSFSPPLSDYVLNNNAIIKARHCVGGDCLGAQTFGNETLLLKDKVVWIRFNDTSSTSSYPKHDWEIRCNDAGMGGRNAFMIYDLGPYLNYEQNIFTLEAGAGTNAFYLRSNGNLGIGTNTANEKLEVNGDMHADGDISATGTISSVSDARLKRNVQPLENGIEFIRQLNPVRYEFRTNEYSALNLAEGLQYGLIAQEVEGVMPELVNNGMKTINKEGETMDLKVLNCLGFSPVMINAMQ